MLPRGHDMQREVLLNINDEKTFLSACTVDKATYKLCDDIFFRNRIVKQFPILLKDKPKDLSWKDYYLKNVYYMDLLNDLGFTWSGKTSEAESKIYYDILKKYKENYKLEAAIEQASEKGLTDLVVYFVENSKRDGDFDDLFFNNAFHLALASKKTSLVNYFITFIEFEPSDIYFAMKYGDEKLVDLMFEKLGINEETINKAFLGAAASGNKKAFHKYLDMGAELNSNILSGVSVYRDYPANIEWFEYVKSLLDERNIVYDMYKITRLVARNSNLTLFGYLIEKYNMKDVEHLNNFVINILDANRNTDTIPYLLSLGANDYESFYVNARRNAEWREYFSNKLRGF